MGAMLWITTSEHQPSRPWGAPTEIQEFPAFVE